MGSAPKGTLSVVLNRSRARDLAVGDELKMCVEEVATGVGRKSFPSNTLRDLLRFFGKAGDEDKGSNAGRSDAADFFLSTLPGAASFRGEGRSISLSCGRRRTLCESRVRKCAGAKSEMSSLSVRYNCSRV